ncbi:MAG: restriction endonuclease subunit S [Planctomycetaceae bacterium]
MASAAVTIAFLQGNYCTRRSAPIWQRRLSWTSMGFAADMYPINSHIDPGYLLRFMLSKTFLGMAVRNDTRVAMPKINQEELNGILVAVPPLAEQRRIVEKVDQLLGLCDELAARQAAQREKRQRLVGATLDRLVTCRDPAEFPTHTHRLRNHFDRLFDTPTTIPQLRQTILQLAVQGQLVPQDPDDELAEKLFVTSTKAEGKKPKWAAPIEEQEKPFQLPSSWTWFRLGDISILKHGYAFSSEFFTSEPAPFVLTTPGNFYEKGGFRDRESKRKYYSGPVDPEFIFKPGDMIIPMTEQAAGLLGSPAFIPDDGRVYIHNQRLGKLRFSESIAPEFAFWFFNSEFFRRELARTCTGMKVRHTSPDRILRVLFPLPPLTEQKRIVTKVTELLSLCDALEAKLTQAKSASTQLLSAAVHHLLNGADSDD